MSVWFWVCVAGVVCVVPFLFLSVEHTKLQEKYGKKKGTRIGEICGIVSGWLFFIFWAGIWVSPQPRFTIPFPVAVSFLVPFVNFSISLSNLVASVPFILVGAWLGIEGVREVSLRVAETHRPDRIVTSGVYSLVRHPQYLGGLLSHVGISILLSAYRSFLITPLMIVIVYLISWKEERELIKEFGKDYEEYKKRVPMFIPRVRRREAETNKKHNSVNSSERGLEKFARRVFVTETSL